MSLFHDSALVGASGSSGAAGYLVERSLRFNSSDSAYLSRTPASAGNRKTWTWAGWVKRSALSAKRQELFRCNTAPLTQFGFSESAQGNPESLLIFSNGGAYLITTPVFRDVSAWYHITVVFDTTNSTTGDRVRVYVNGSRITTFNSASYPAQNFDTSINTTNLHYIGASGNANEYLDGYLADVHFIDGQALDPTSFTEVSATTGQLIPKAYTGTFGTNGFWLKFSDNSAATATTLGKDYSPNGNNWTPTNFAINTSTLNYSSYWVAGGNNNAPIGPNNAFDGSTSTYFRTNGSSNTQTWTPPSSIAYTSLRVYVYNIVGSSTNVLFVNGVAQTTPTSTGWFTPSGVSSPLTSIEIRETASTALGIAAVEINSGILLDQSWPGNDSLVDTPTSYGTGNSGGDVRGNYATLNPLDKANIGSAVLSNGNLDYNSTSGGNRAPSTIGVSSGKWYMEMTANTSGNASWTVGVIDSATGSIAVSYYAFDGKIYPAGTTYGNTYTAGDVIGVALDLDNGKIFFSKNGTWQNSGNPTTGTNPAASSLSGTYAFFVGHGSGASTSTSTANFGQRPFAYTAPSGFKALCDTNLPAPVVAKPNTVFDAVRFVGNSGTNAITLPGGFSPDLVWTKSRNNALDHLLYDSVRGVGRYLRSNTTGSEGGPNTSTLASFDSSGFTLGAGDDANTSASAVAWAWDAGSSTVTNTQGSITSSCRANPSSGFSIVGYTGTGSSGSLGHGLNVKPQLIIVKSRTQARDWLVYHSSYGATQYMTLNGTGAAAATSSAWNNTEPTSTVFTIGNAAEINTNGSTNIAYCFSPVAGYSSFGSYVGNGSSDGVFVYTGHRPRWILLKATSIANESWIIIDTARSTYNVVDAFLRADTSGAEFSSSLRYVDILSNGFKLRASGTEVNGSGTTYVYASFAESPFAYARAR